MSEVRTIHESPSVIAPVSRALEWMVHVLFRPFDFTKWFVLGFCGWLAWLGEAGSGSFNWNRGSVDDLRDRYDQASSWVFEHLELIVFLVVSLILIGFLFWVLFVWLSSRGKFMFLDGVAHDRAAVVEPWHRFRQNGNSLFGFRLLLGLVGFVTIGLLVALMVLSLLPFQHADPSLGLILFAVMWLLILMALIFVFVLVAMTVTDFVVPIMWVRGCRVRQAWSEFLSLFSANPGPFVLYVLFKIVIAIVMGLVGCVATCLTCCLAALPYIGTVILLPLYVFHRAYSMYFLAQFDRDYAALAPATPQPAAAPSRPPSTSDPR